MSSATSGPAQPLIIKLREIADAEQAHRARADAAVTEAERVLYEARQAQRVAVERHSAAAATVEAAEAYAAGLGTGAAQAGPDAEACGAAAPAEPPSAPSRSVGSLIVDVLELGQVTQLHVIYQGIRRLRPGTTNSSIRGSLTHLHQRGVVEIVSRGSYRLLKIPEDYQTHA
ncbi:hypothetical protein ABT218_29065 [Streptomyces sp. NPDC001455]|uniref:hypothetical protein n=1 Tax=Streptomyces sp. NPDC001455 TaxID=3154518 RepID=UPI0033168821